MKQPKKLTPPTKPVGKELYFETKEITTHYYHSEEQYGDWESSKDCSLEKVSRNKDLLRKWDFTSHIVPDEVYNADHVYVVVVTYSSGDTFGRSDGNIALAFVSENPDEAIAAKRAIEDDIWSVKFDNHPKRIDGGCPAWSGYFESVSNVSIEFRPVIG